MERLDDDRINQILDKVDVDKNGTIEYSEFLAHSLTSKQLSHRNLQLFFDQMKPAIKDEGKVEEGATAKKYLTVKLMHEYMVKCARTVKESKLKKMIKGTILEQEDGIIDFECFKTFMMSFLMDEHRGSVANNETY